MLKSEVGVCNFSTKLSPFDVNMHLFMWNKLSTGENDRNNFSHMLK